MSAEIYNPNLPNTTIAAGYETVTSDSQGNFLFADEEAAQKLLQTNGWFEGKNPEKPPEEAKNRDPKVLIDKLRTEVLEQRQTIVALEAENSSLKERLGEPTDVAVEKDGPDPSGASEEPQEDAQEADDEEAEGTDEDEGEEEGDEPSMHWKKSELISYAGEHEIEIDPSWTKSEILAELGFEAEE